MEVGASVDLPLYTLAEVAAHNKDGDCWVVVDGVVCDVSSYMLKHPGGKDLIFRSAGCDVTKDFAAMFHSVRAKAKLQELCIGRVKGAKAPSSLDPFRSPMMPPVSRGGPYGLGPTSASHSVVAVALPAKWATNNYTSLSLSSNNPSGQDVSGARLLTFDLPIHAPSSIHACQHVRVEWNGVVRSYTPIRWERGSFTLLVKPYPEPHGIVSRHLCSMRPAERLDVCGPISSGFDLIKYRASSELVLISMGTGITPMLQLLREIQVREWGRGRSTLRVHLCHAARSANDVFCAKELREIIALSGTQVLQVHLFFSHEPGALPTRLSPEAALERSAVVGDFSVLLCGTDSFVAEHKTFFEQRQCRVYPL